MKHIFISYNSHNKTEAESMRFMLKNCSLDTWMAPYDIPVGSKYAAEITKALRNSYCFLLLLSEYAQSSEYVGKELERAVYYKVPIVAMQLDNVILNDEFEYYLSNQQIVKVKKIDSNADEFKSIIEAIRFFHNASEKSDTLQKQISEPVIKKNKTINITIWSPVNVNVYFNDKSHHLMYIDNNSGFDYKYNTIQASGYFDLIFVSKGFEKTIRFNADGVDSIEYQLGPILSKLEIINSYDREEALSLLKNNEPTGYAFETLQTVGTVDDIGVMVNWLQQWVHKTVKDHSINYLIARACGAIAKLAIKYNDGNPIRLIKEIYDNYNAKKSYGYIIEDALNKLYSYQTSHPRKTKIFLLYAHGDEEIARIVYNWFETKGYSVCGNLDVFATAEPTQKLRDVLYDKIREYSNEDGVIIPIFTENSTDKPSFMAELGYVLGLKTTVLPIVIGASINIPFDVADFIYYRLDIEHIPSSLECLSGMIQRM